MTRDKEPFESLTATAEQMTKQTQRAMEDYFTWFQTNMTATPYTDLNQKLLSYANENVTAAVAYMQKLSEAKNFGDIAKIQTEFMSTQFNSFNERAKTIGAICTKAVAAATKTQFSMSR
jgi:hypothetical protein